MLIGFVGFGIVAAFGLDWIAHRLSGKLRYSVILMAVILVLLENMPEPWRKEKLRTVPQFYKEIAQDEQQYGVLDLPIRPSQEHTYSSWHIYYSSYYQMYQMTHGKGIAVGYVDRPYDIHPLFGYFISDFAKASPLQADILVNGVPTNRYTNVQFELVRNNYRYVVYHKPQEAYPLYKPGSWGELATEQFIEQVFGKQVPIVDDELVTVYQVDTVTETEKAITTTIALRESKSQNWLEIVTGKRWALSPTTFYVASPNSQQACLEVTPGDIRDHDSDTSYDSGMLTLQTGAGSVSAYATPGRTTRLPLTLAPPSRIITLTLEGENATRLDFAIESINLQTPITLPDDILINEQSQQGKESPITAIYSRGWHTPEIWDDSGVTWRWAMSPAQLFLYSPTTQTVQLQSAIGSLHDPDSEDGKGNQGTMSMTVNDRAPLKLGVRVGEPFIADVPLQPGWNSIVFNLEAGNFRPADIQPGNGDGRLLSFALRTINIQTE